MPIRSIVPLVLGVAVLVLGGLFVRSAWRDLDEAERYRKLAERDVAGAKALLPPGQDHVAREHALQFDDAMRSADLYGATAREIQVRGEGRALAAGGCGVGGLAAVALGLWLRRRKPTAASAPAPYASASPRR